jgi:hypothetical protein
MSLRACTGLDFLLVEYHHCLEEDIVELIQMFNDQIIMLTV